MKNLLNITSVAVLTFLMIAITPAYAEVHVESLWLRESIPGQPNGAGFGTLRNRGSEDMLLVGASTSVASDVEIHQHVREGEQMRMEQIEVLVIPAGESITLQPGGYHLMLMQLNEPLRVGDTHEVVLIFSDGTALNVASEVRALVQNHQGRH